MMQLPTSGEPDDVAKTHKVKKKEGGPEKLLALQDELWMNGVFLSL